MDSESIIILTLGVCALGSLLVLVPFLLYHQRKMAEIVHRRSAIADDVANRVDRLTDAVYQLSARLDQTPSFGTPPPVDRIELDRQSSLP